MSTKTYRELPVFDSLAPGPARPGDFKRSIVVAWVATIDHAVCDSTGTPTIVYVARLKDGSFWALRWSNPYLTDAAGTLRRISDRLMLLQFSHDKYTIAYWTRLKEANSK